MADLILAPDSPLDASRHHLSTTEAAQLLGLEPKTLNKYARMGLIPGAFKAFAGRRGTRGQGARWRFKKRELLEWWDWRTTGKPRQMRLSAKAKA